VRHALGLDAADWHEGVVGKWTAHATRNADLPAPQRCGIVVPMSVSVAGAHAEPSLVIPAEPI
jgi:hypothetical protein